MEIKLITTNVTTSGGGGVKFRFLGNVEIRKTPILFGTTMKPNQTVRFVVNGNTSGVTSNDESYFELYSDKVINSIKVYNEITLPDYTIEYDGSLLKTLDVSHFDTSQVTNMSKMFENCYYLTSLDLSNFDTSKVTDMSYMFNGCSKLTYLDLSKWNTSRANKMSYMFSSCTSLRTIKINDQASANKLIAQIQTDLSKTATWNPETKIITIPA